MSRPNRDEGNRQKGSDLESRGLQDAIDTFREVFGREPTHCSRAPGRVNLIGEHTDYNGLAVLPMALRQEVGILFAPRADGTVRVANVEPEFGFRDFALSDHIPHNSPGDWANYLKAPCESLVRRFDELEGIDALVTSTLPVASGLSSSSALVIAVGNALLEANDMALPTLDFARSMARAERYTGTQGGGMDQAISAGALEGHASRIEFAPLRMSEIPVPPHWRFVVAHSLVRAEKSGSAQRAYNKRTLECEDALQAFRGALPDHDWTQPEDLSYAELLNHFCIQELVDLCESHLEEVLLKRFRHVVTEGTRVYDAEQALRRDDLVTFGLLMNASHQSLRDDFEVSSPELNHLVDLALDAGAAGARLTGAGFGGCIVALTDPGRLERVMSALEKGFYQKRGIPTPNDQLLFVAEPAPGASVGPL